MSSTSALKGRIKSVKNTKQITKAMQLVAASKMRRAQDMATKSRDFKNLAAQLLTRLRELTDVSKHPLFAVREVKTRLYILVTSDRGLAGAYNSNMLRAFMAELKSDREKSVKSQIILVGKQGAKFAARIEDLEVISAYHGLNDKPTVDQMRPLLEQIITLYTDQKVDAVDVLYTDFKSSVVQIVTNQHLLPAAFTEVELTEEMHEATFEPSVQAVLDNVTKRLVESQLWQSLVESQASEHSMRMMAMKSATDNASDLIDDLTLEMNTARQAAITQELAEITGGAEAIK